MGHALVAPFKFGLQTSFNQPTVTGLRRHLVPVFEKTASEMPGQQMVDCVETRIRLDPNQRYICPNGFNNIAVKTQHLLGEIEFDRRSRTNRYLFVPGQILFLQAGVSGSSGRGPYLALRPRDFPRVKLPLKRRCARGAVHPLQSRSLVTWLTSPVSDSLFPEYLRNANESPPSTFRYPSFQPPAESRSVGD